jgi:hypothetical protein
MGRHIVRALDFDGNAGNDIKHIKTTGGGSAALTRHVTRSRKGAGATQAVFLLESASFIDKNRNSAICRLGDVPSPIARAVVVTLRNCFALLRRWTRCSAGGDEDDDSYPSKHRK